MSLGKYPLLMIVAASRNGVIGRNGQLPWRLSSDLQRFRRLTWGHHLIMGRKTFESINRLLPGRTTIVITRQADWQVHGVRIAHSVDQVLELVAHDEQPFVVGGADVYRTFLPWTGRLYLTRVEADVEGDTLMPDVDWRQWVVEQSAHFRADQRNEYDYSFLDYVRRP